MDLRDFVEDSSKLFEDDLTGLIVNNGKTEVLGLYLDGKPGKMYLVRCSVCCLDEELYGEGIFKQSRANLISGSTPCGCSPSKQYTENEWRILSHRSADERGYYFDGWAEPYKAGKTLCRLICPKHGEWTTTRAKDLAAGRGCSKCMFEGRSERCKISDGEMIERFFSTNCFHPDTIFYRIDRKNSMGRKVFWKMECPVCGLNGEATGTSLQNGARPCGCGKNRQTFAYINSIRKEDETFVLKFGIANNPIKRLYNQRDGSDLVVENILIFEFPDKDTCRAAEKECKVLLETGVLTREVFKDGYTETTYLHNICKIIEIYESHGGIIMSHKLPSQKRAFDELMKQECQAKQEVFAAALRHVNRIILEADFLTDEQKESLQKEIWCKYE